MKPIVFIPLLVTLVVAFGFFIGFMAKKLGGNIAARLYRLIEGLLIAGIILGVVGMFQPWALPLYTYGFSFVLFSTLAFTVWSHITPRPQQS